MMTEHTDPGAHPSHARPGPAASASRPPDTPNTVVSHSEFAVHGDPSLRRHLRLNAQGSDSGVTWMRPTELAARAGGRIAGYGIDFQEELMRRIRAGLRRDSRHTARAQAPRLADLSLGGRDYPTEEPTAERSRLGLR